MRPARAQTRPCPGLDGELTVRSRRSRAPCLANSGIVAIGVLLLIIAGIGCWGALKENRVLLIVYFSLILFFTIVEFAVGIAAYVHKDDLPAYASQMWSTLYNNDRNAIDDIEKRFACCGYSELYDRAVPPFGDEETCAFSLYPNYGACSVNIPGKVADRYSTSPAAGIELASSIQNNETCCGWLSVYENGTETAWGATSVDDPTPCSVTYPERTKPCFEAIQANWTAHYNLRNAEGEEYILAWEHAVRIWSARRESREWPVLTARSPFRVLSPVPPSVHVLWLGDADVAAGAAALQRHVRGRLRLPAALRARHDRRRHGGPRRRRRCLHRPGHPPACHHGRHHLPDPPDAQGRPPRRRPRDAGAAGNDRRGVARVPAFLCAHTILVSAALLASPSLHEAAVRFRLQCGAHCTDRRF